MNIEEMRDICKNASPRPWIFIDKGGDRYEIEAQPKSKEKYIASLFDNEDYYPTAPSIEDAKFIVMAVNDVEKLREAVKILYVEMRHFSNMGSSVNYRARQALLNPKVMAIIDIDMICAYKGDE